MYVAGIIYYIAVEVEALFRQEWIDFVVERHESNVVLDGPRVAMEEVCDFARSEIEMLSEDVCGYTTFGDGVAVGVEMFTTTILFHLDFDDVGVRSVPPPHRLINQCIRHF